MSQLGLISLESLAEWEVLSGATCYKVNQPTNDPRVLVSNDGGPGFISWYAQNSVVEDRAEIFAHCVLRPNRVARISKNDAIIQAKVKKLKELLQKVCPEIDGDFYVNHDAFDSEQDR